MTERELLEERNELLKVMVTILLDDNLDTTEEKAKYLNQYNFTHQEIGNLLNKDRTTISHYLGDD